MIVHRTVIILSFAMSVTGEKAQTPKEGNEVLTNDFVPAYGNQTLMEQQRYKPVLDICVLSWLKLMTNCKGK